jgi:hypothetical protein
MWGGGELLLGRRLAGNLRILFTLTQEEKAAMTSLAVALAIDSRGPTGIYIITDSRLTWSLPGSPRWDAGQKTFASTRTPDIFGFCGDAFFPPMVLRQFLDQVNSGLILHNDTNSEARHAVFKSMLEKTFSRGVGVPVRAFSIFHGARDGDLMKSHFRLWETRYFSDTKKWTDAERNLTTDHSYFAHVDGTGKEYIVKRGQEWLDTDAEGTSRAAIWSFCNALHEGNDPQSGGPPQLVGIWRKGLAQTFGFWWRGYPYLSGAPVPSKSDFEKVNWFNHRFERCDGRTGKRLEDAQKHIKPKPNVSIK